jgi:hypothetical protein
LRWEAAREAWRALGLALPPYERSGMVFAIDVSGNVVNEVRLDGQILAVDLTPLRELANIKPWDAARPVSSLIPELELLEVPKRHPGVFHEIGRFLGLGY